MIQTYLDLARLHAPWLIIAAPLVGAALAIALPRGSWLSAVLAASAAAILSGDLALRALTSETPVIAGQEGVRLSVEGVSIFAAAVLAGAAVLIALAAGALREFSAEISPFAAALFLCIGAGWTAALFAPDLLGVIIGAELAWLAATGLTALSAEGGRGALNGAMRMLGAGGAGAALSVLGAAMTTRAVGSSALVTIAEEPIAAPNLAVAGFALIFVSLAMKAGLAPLHAWAPAAFGRGSRWSGLALGAISIIGALSVLTRVAAVTSAAPALALGAAAVLIVLGAASVLIGSVQAVGASDLRRLAAYAAASQGGCIVLGEAIGSPAGLAASLVQIVALAAAMIALLGGAAVAGGSLGNLNGLARRAPLSSAAITAGALSLIGAPLTIGFLGRWRMIEAGVAADWWWATGAALAASLAAVIYGGRLIERIYFRFAHMPPASDRTWMRILIAPALLAAIVVIALGLDPQWLLDAAANAAQLQVGRP